MSGLTPVQQAAAFHGLTTNMTVPPRERLALALQALDLYATEVERLTYERDQRIAESERLGDKANELVRTASFHRDRANEAARLSAAARDDADDLRKTIAKLEEKVEDREGQLTDRDAWAVRVCTENNLYELPLNVEDEFGAIALYLREARKGVAESGRQVDRAFAMREEAIREVEALRLGTDVVTAEQLSDALRERDEARAELERYHRLHEDLAEADAIADAFMPADLVVEAWGGPYRPPVAVLAVRVADLERLLAKVNGEHLDRPESPVPAPLTSPSDPPGMRVTGIEYGPPDSKVAAQGRDRSPGGES